MYGEAWLGEEGHRGCGLQDWGVIQPYSFGDDAFCSGGHGYETLFWLPLCEVGVDVVKDVGCVGVQVPACEGLCYVFWCVARVLERIIGVLVLARSAWFVRAVRDCDSCGVEAGPGGRRVE